MSVDATRKNYYGKYRGKVFANIDPDEKGRILVLVPDVLGSTPSTWATPCVPFTGPFQTGMFVLPMIGADVWVEFEHGDSNHPIWSGGFWGSNLAVPPTALLDPPAAPGVVVQTVGQNTLWISGNPLTGIALTCGPPESPTSPGIVISQTGIVIQDGKGGSIAITAGVVTINLGALIIK